MTGFVLDRVNARDISIHDVTVQVGPSAAEAPERLRFEWLFAQHALFAGREEELGQLDRFCEQPGGGYLFVTAPSGFGKTAVLVNWVRTLAAEGQQVAYAFVNRLAGHADEDVILRALCQQLAVIHGDTGSLPTMTGELRALYLRFLLTAPSAGGRVAVIVDGLDEAEGWEAKPDLFPPGLPDGVRVVFSAREVAGRDWLESLGFGGRPVERLRLTKLGPVEIARILAAADEALPAWAEAPEMANEMFDISAGDPFYVRYLVADLLPDEGGTVRIASLEELRRQPSGLDGYFDSWWQELELARQSAPARDLLGYLLVAKGPLGRDDLSDLSAEDALDGWTVDDALALVRRQTVGDDETSVALAHPRFQTYLAEKRLREPEQRVFRERLIAYCARWPETQSRYALLHYADHLLADVTRTDELLALGRDAAFAAAQRRLCPDDPLLPARVCGLAFAAAAGRDDVAGMTEAALRKAAALAAARTAFSPLAAVRSVSLQAAWSLADLHGPERRALWHLLLAWDLHAAGRDAEAAATLDRLVGGELVELEEDAVWRPIFRPSGEVDAALASELETRLLTTPTRALVAVDAAAALARSGDRIAAGSGFAAAVAITQQIANSMDRAVVRAAVAKAQLEAGDRDSARESYGTAVQELAKSGGWLELTVAAGLLEEQAEAGDAAGALASVERIGAVAKLEDASELEGELELMLRHLVHAQAGAVEAAISAAEMISDEDDRAKALLAIGKTLAAAGDHAGAGCAYARAGEAAQSIDDEPDRAKLLAAVAAGQASAGNATAAEASLATALAASQSDESDEPEPDVVKALAEALAAIGGAQAHADEHDAAQESLKAARETAVAVADDLTRTQALVAVAEAQARVGDPASARETVRAAVRAAQAIASDGERAQALAELGSMQAEAGDVASASETYGAALAASQRLTGGKERTKTLATVAFAQAATDEGAARETYAAAIWDAPVAIPNDAWRADALARLAEAQARVGDSAARETALAIEDEVKREAALAAIAGSEADSGDIAAALATASAIADESLRSETLVTIARAQAQAGDVAGARRTADGIDDQSRRVCALVAVAQAQSEAGDTVGARESGALAFERARATNEPRSIAAAACELVRAGDLDASRAAARAIIDGAKAGTGRRGFFGWVASLFTPGSGPWLEALSDLATAQATAGDASGAQESFLAARQIVHALESDRTRRGALPTLANAHARAGDFAAAREIALEIDDDRQRAEALAAVADAQARAGETAGALQTAQEIDGSSDSIQAIRAVAVARASGGEAVARDAALLIEDASARAQALTGVADAQVASGHPDIAYETALAIDESSRAPALALVGGAYALAGDAAAALRCYTEALEDAQAIAGEADRSEVFALIVASEVRDGFAGDAIRLLDASVRPRVLEALAIALAETGETALLKRAVEACAEYEELGPVICESLARAYPAQVTETVERVLPMLTNRLAPATHTRATSEAHPSAA